ncbi:MAG: DJ-1/PfpI family protein [Moorellales bacterium]
MRRRSRIQLLALLAVAVLAAGCGRGEKSAPVPAGSPADKKVVMVVAHRDFRDEEFFEPKKILEERGAKVLVASSSLEEARGMLGGTLKPDLPLKDVRAADYDAVIFVGGEGAREYWDDLEAHRVAREALEQGKVLGAICLAPVTLANAGVLSGRKATVWHDEAARLEASGAEYTGARVEVDGRVVTAGGPESAKEFGEAVARLLGGQAPDREGDDER